ncbi:MAG: chemotaxis protein CheW [Myxococcaceae bacterium]
MKNANHKQEQHDDEELLDADDTNIDHTYLTFQVGESEYAVEVSCVTEIVRLQKTFAVPDVPDCVRGVINLRGKVIPLIDVRARFGLAEAQYTDRTVVVVLEAQNSSTGLVVDGVSEVTEIPPEQIEQRASLKSLGRQSVVKGVGKRASRVSFILDVPSLLSADGAATAS